MILILTGDGDLSCDLVMDWLNYHNAECQRINTFDLLHNKIEFVLEKNDTRFVIDDKYVSLKDINVVWYRKFGFFEDSEEYIKIHKNYNIDNSLQLIREFNKVLYFLLLNLREKRWLTNPFKINLNKPYVLQTAKNYGLEIPKTYIVNSASDLLKDVSLICKSILDPMIAKYENNDCMMYTSQISDADFQNLPARFLPSYIQEKIEKKYEVRIFYLNGRCYSMSIFSQKDIQTETDFRNYNWEKPNRFVPYQLPKEEGIKIKKLMQHLGLNCGSIDLIKAINDKYYFLEINPTGQFGMVDFPCNYGLHKKVAETLIEMDK